MESAALIELDPFCRSQGFYKFGSSPGQSQREDGASHLVYFLQGLEADTILLNPVREVPSMAKYLPPVWLWVALVSGSIGLKHKLPKEERQAYLCKNTRGWGSELGSRLRSQAPASGGSSAGEWLYLENGKTPKLWFLSNLKTLSAGVLAGCTSPPLLRAEAEKKKKTAEISGSNLRCSQKKHLS